MTAPTIEIDFARTFSLPFGLAPSVDPAYVATLGVDAGYARFVRRVVAPVWPPVPREVATIPFADGSGKAAVVPAWTSADLGVPTTRGVLTSAAIALVGAEVPLANGYRWDAVAVKTGPFPLPALDDGALVLCWSPAPGPSPAGAVTDGILESLLADYLLATHATGGDGEAARDLLRAPMVGLARFERYRHLVLNGAALSVGAASATGAVVVRSRAGGVVPSAGHPPSLGSCLVVFENVDRVAAVACLGRLAWCLVVRGGDVAGTPALRADGAVTRRLLAQSFIDYAHVARATHRPAVADPLPALDAALRQPFEKAVPKPTAAQVDALVEACVLSVSVRDALRDFVTTVFVELLTGATWSEIGCTAVGGAVAPPAGQQDAHARLAALPASTQGWLPCYAGAPVGRAASVVRRAGPAPAIADAAQAAIAPFHFEALAAAGQPPPATQPFGTLATLRVIDDGGRDTLLTTRDLLDAIVKGENVRRSTPAPIDLAPLAALGHPYAAAVDWTRFVAARTARTRLDDLLAQRPRPDAANVAFWTGRTGLLQGGLWPAVGVGALGAPNESPPTPAAPYATRATRTFPAASGFDEYDLEAVLRARSVVRDGRTGRTDIPVPLFLALLDRESYRAFGEFDRPAMRVDAPNQDIAPGVTAEDLRAISLTNWLVFPFGLDLLTAGTPVAAGQPTGFPLRQLPAGAKLDQVPSRFKTSFPSIHGQLTALGLLATDLEPLLAEADCLDYLGVRRRGRFLTPKGISVVLRSRSAQWMAIALQMATFQWVHQQLVAATGTRHVTTNTNDAWVRVDEFVSGAPPVPGADANTPERRRFIAYWALVYLGFNTSPGTWNCWVNSVPDATLTAGTLASVFLTDRKNVAPRSVDGPHDGPEKRLIGQRGHMVRFAAGLDAYMRIGVDGDAADTSDPAARAWPLP